MGDAFKNVKNRLVALSGKWPDEKVAKALVCLMDDEFIEKVHGLESGAFEAGVEDFLAHDSQGGSSLISPTNTLPAWHDESRVKYASSNTNVNHP